MSILKKLFLTLFFLGSVVPFTACEREPVEPVGPIEERQGPIEERQGPLEEREGPVQPGGPVEER